MQKPAALTFFNSFIEHLSYCSNIKSWIKSENKIRVYKLIVTKKYLHKVCTIVKYIPSVGRAVHVEAVIRFIHRANI